MILSRCAPQKAPDNPGPNDRIDTKAELPRVVTNLDSVSSASTYAPPQAELPPIQASSINGVGPSKNEVVTHKLAATAPGTRYNPEPAPKVGPGGSQLLNDKARQFANFSDILLGQTLKAAQQLAPDQLQRRRVPTDLHPVLLTAVLDPQGRLREIIVEQHSGDLLVDKLFIEACKKGMWSRNPPPEAHAPDGNYRLRVKGIVYNSSFDRYGEYTYDTELGLAIL